MSVVMNPGATALTVIVPRGQLAGDRPGEADHARLARRVVGLARVAHQARDAGDVDDPAVPLPHHHRADGPAEEERPLEVGLDHLVPGVVLHAEHQAVPGDPGVIDQDVDLARISPRPPRRSAATSAALGDAAGEPLGRAPGLADGLRASPPGPRASGPRRRPSPRRRPAARRSPGRSRARPPVTRATWPVRSTLQPEGAGRCWPSRGRPFLGDDRRPASPGRGGCPLVIIGVGLRPSTPSGAGRSHSNAACQPAHARRHPPLPHP